MNKKIEEKISLMKSGCLKIWIGLKIQVTLVLDRAVQRFNHRLTLAARNVLIFASGVVLTVVVYSLI